MRYNAIVAWLRGKADENRRSAEIHPCILLEAIADDIEKGTAMVGVERLADICEALHMSHTGASDPLDDAVKARLIAYLKHRLDNWRPSIKDCAAYDDAFRALIEATLAEQGREGFE